MSDVFLRVRRKDDDGISMALIDWFPDCPAELEEHINAATGLTCHGLLSLLTGHVRDLRLDVVADSATHANITGLPFRDDDEVEAERLADDLLAIARLRWCRRRKDHWPEPSHPLITVDR